MQTRVLVILVFLLLTLIGCSRTSDIPASNQQSQDVLRGTVDITFPASGSIIYSESILVQGTSTNTAEDGFRIQLVTADETVLNEAIVQAAGDGTWSVELVHNYSGDPTEMALVARNTSPESTLEYDIESIAIAPLEFRPDGVFGSIQIPQEGDQVGGDSIYVAGRASGFFENTIILSLVNTEDDVIVEIPVTINNPNFIDDVQWEAEIPRNDFIGNGSIRISYQDAESGDTVIVDEVPVVVSSVAG